MSHMTTVKSRPGASTSAMFVALWRRAVADKIVIVAALAFYGIAMGVVVGALWQPLQDTFADLADSLPAGFDAILGGVSLATSEGWMNAELLSIVGPAFLIAAGVISASAATAGEEQSRTLGLVLSTGVSRRTFFAAKSVAVLTHLLIVDAAIFAGMLIGTAIGDMGLGVGALAVASLWMLFLGAMYSAIALLVGVLIGNRRLAMVIPAALAAASFVLAMFLPLDEDLTDLAKLNLWYPYSGTVALVDGIDWALASVMLGVTALAMLLGFVALARRINLKG